MKALSGKTVIITGAARGIGYALAQSCAAKQMNVVMTDIEGETLQASADRLRESGAQILAIKADVLKPESWIEVKEKSVQAFGTINILVNNAGVLGTPARTWEVNSAEWSRVLDINLNSVILGISTFVPLMKEQDSPAHIVNIASVAGHATQPFLAPYHVTKFGVTAITECLFHEFEVLDIDIGLTLVAPGFTRTNIMSKKNFADGSNDDPHMAKLHETFQGGVEGGASPEDVAEQILQAVQGNQFYVFTSPGTIELVKSRFDKILNFENPDLGDPIRSRYLLQKEH